MRRNRISFNSILVQRIGDGPLFTRSWTQWLRTISTVVAALIAAAASAGMFDVLRYEPSPELLKAAIAPLLALSLMQALISAIVPGVKRAVIGAIFVLPVTFMTIFSFPPPPGITGFMWAWSAVLASLVIELVAELIDARRGGANGPREE